MTARLTTRRLTPAQVRPSWERRRASLVLDRLLNVPGRVPAPEDIHAEGCDCEWCEAVRP